MAFEKYATQREAAPFFIGLLQANIDMIKDYLERGDTQDIKAALIRAIRCQNISLEYDLLPLVKDHNAPT